MTCLNTSEVQLQADKNGIYLLGKGFGPVSGKHELDFVFGANFWELDVEYDGCHPVSPKQGRYGSQNKEFSSSLDKTEAWRISRDFGRIFGKFQMHIREEW